MGRKKKTDWISGLMVSFHLDIGQLCDVREIITCHRPTFSHLENEKLGLDAFDKSVFCFKLSRFRIDRLLGNNLLYPNILILSYSIVFTGILSNLHNCKNEVVSPLVKNRYVSWHRWNEWNYVCYQEGLKWSYYNQVFVDCSKILLKAFQQKHAPSLLS